MDCTSCGKKRSASSIAAAQAARSVGEASLSPGLSPANPYLLGDADESLLRVRVFRTTGNLRAGQAAWVTGTGVAALVTSGDLIDISKTTQARRLWKVGKYTYTNEIEAQKVASVLGQTAVEIA